MKLASGERVEYHYAFRGGPKIWKTGDPDKPGSPAYLHRLSEALGVGNRTDGKVRGLIIDWQKSNEWLKLAPRTKKDYQRWLNEIDAEFGDAPKAIFNRPAIRPKALKWRDKWTGKQADYAWTVLKAMVSWAYDRGKLEYHHLRGGKALYKSERAEIIWTNDEVDRTEKAASPEVRDAIVIMRTTGLGPADAANLTLNAVQTTAKGRRVFMPRGKTRQMVGAPLLPEAAEIVDKVPDGRR